MNRIDSLKDIPTQDQSSNIEMDSKSPDKAEDNLTIGQNAQQIQPTFYLYKILRAHILPLTNCAFNGDGSRYSLYYLVRCAAKILVLLEQRTKYSHS